MMIKFPPLYLSIDYKNVTEYSVYLNKNRWHPASPKESLGMGTNKEGWRTPRLESGAARGAQALPRLTAMGHRKGDERAQGDSASSLEQIG